MGWQVRKESRQRLVDASDLRREFTTVLTYEIKRARQSDQLLAQEAMVVWRSLGAELDNSGPPAPANPAAV